MNGLVRNMIKVNKIMLAKTRLAKDTDIYYKSYLEYPVDHEKMRWGWGCWPLQRHQTFNTDVYRVCIHV